MHIKVGRAGGEVPILRGDLPVLPDGGERAVLHFQPGVQELHPGVLQPAAERGHRAALEDRGADGEGGDAAARAGGDLLPLRAEQPVPEAQGRTWIKKQISDIEQFLMIFNNDTKFELCRYWEKLDEKGFDPTVELNKSLEIFDIVIS